MNAEVWEALQQLMARRNAAPALVAAPRPRDVPLSFSQERLWLLHEARPEVPTYNLPWAVALAGRLDAAALERALQDVVARHEALRTTFASRGGRPVQVIGSGAGWRLARVELDGAEPGGEAMTQALAREAARPFDLARELPLRATLFRAGAEAHVLLLTAHHIAYDAWSQDLLFREVSERYPRRLEGGAPDAPDAPAVAYADYAVWQRAWLSGPTLEELRAFWRDELQGPLEPPRLRPPEAAGGARTMATLTARLPAELPAGLAGLSRRAGGTLYMTLLAAFQVVLHAHTGQRRFFVCSPAAGRARPELEGLIGYFVNLLVLRAELDGELAFTEVLARVRRTVARATAHQDLPVQLIDGLELAARELSTALFSLENTPGDPLALEGVRATPLALDGGVADFDVFLAVRERDGELTASLRYAAGAIAAELADALLRDWIAVLGAAVADPARRVAELLPPRAAAAPPAVAVAPGRDPRPGPDAAGAAGAGDVAARLRAAPPEAGRPILRAYLRAQLARVAGPGGAGASGLRELALGSLELIDLSSRVRGDLAIDVPIARFFADETLDALADELYERWLKARVRKADPEADPEPDPDAAEVAIEWETVRF